MAPQPRASGDPPAVDLVRSTGPIVLGTDFGPVSARAEQVAIGLAAVGHVPLIIVNAVDTGPLRLPGGLFVQRVDQARSVRQARATRFVEHVRAAGVQPQVLIWEGDPASCVVEAARAEGASRIVVGSHRRGLLGRTLVGSVSAAIAAHADCPVQIVRSDETADDASDGVVESADPADPADVSRAITAFKRAAR